jgi:hypothetical protein
MRTSCSHPLLKFTLASLPGGTVRLIAVSHFAVPLGRTATAVIDCTPALLIEKVLASASAALIWQMPANRNPR